MNITCRSGGEGSGGEGMRGEGMGRREVWWEGEEMTAMW